MFYSTNARKNQQTIVGLFMLFFSRTYILLYLIKKFGMIIYAMLIFIFFMHMYREYNHYCRQLDCLIQVSNI